MGTWNIFYIKRDLPFRGLEIFLKKGDSHEFHIHFYFINIANKGLEANSVCSKLIGVFKVKLHAVVVLTLNKSLVKLYINLKEESH